MSRHLTCCIAFVTILEFVAATPGRALEPESDPTRESVVVQSIGWRGNDALSSGLLADHILAEAPPWFAWWRTVEFSEVELKNDMDRIVGLYQRQGYYEARASYELSWDDAHRKVWIEIRIDEGASIELAFVQVSAPDRVDRVIAESEKFEEWQSFIDRLPMQEGQIFELEAYRASQRAILERMGQLGFPDARVEGGADVDLESHRATVSWTVIPGARARIKDILIEGLEKVDEYVVRRALTIEQGDWYSRSEIARTRRKLQNLGLFRFSDVELLPGSEETASDAVEARPLRIRFTERPPRRVRVGGGWGTDDSFRGEISWHHRNFFGGGRHADVSLTGSGLGLALRPTFMEPYFLGFPTRFLLSSAIAHQVEDAYTADRILLDMQWSYSFKDSPWTILAGYSLDRSDIYDVTDPRGPDELPEGLSIVSGPHLGFVRSTVVDPLNAKSGSLFDVRAETSFRFLGAEEDFARYTVEGRLFHELFGTVVAARLMLGSIQNIDSTETFDIPLVERFYSGGSSSMRGFGYRKLSPLDDNSDPVGGSSIFESSLEWRIPFFRKFGVVAFVDGAVVSPKSFNWQLAKLHYAAGPGLRYLTPAGPLRFDVAWRLNRRRRGDIRFNASLGHTF